MSGQPPVCAQCALYMGIGHLGTDGSVIEPDPEPDDPGVHSHGRWFCTDDCLESWKEEQNDR